MMNTPAFGWRTVILAAAALLFAQFPARAQGTLHARVSFDAGGTMVRGTEDSDWSHATMNTLILPGDTLWVDEGGTTELELSGGTFVRLADGSKAEVYSLSPSIEFRAWVGSVYVQRISRSTGDVAVQTPAGAVLVDRDSSARIDVLEDGSTMVSVRWGSARVRGSGGALETVGARQRVYIDPGMLPSEVVSFDLSPEDDFDAWNRERSQVLATGVTAVPESLAVTAETIGVSDLGAYGEWVTLDDGPYWRPTVADYVPYRDGHWSFVPSVGYTWIENYPFAYCTSHYGRWRYIERYGWCWRYDPHWAPAWCATIRYGDHFMWSPIGFDNRPVHVMGAATFDIGGIQFSLAATSYVPRDYLYYGGYVAPVRPAIVQDIDITNINIWNISLNDSSPYVNLPFRDKRIGVYSERPKRILRGPDRLAGKEVSARLIASDLEERTGKGKFEAEKKADRADARTAARPDQDRRMKREVKLEAKQRVAKRDPNEIKEETKARRDAQKKREEPVVAAFDEGAQDKAERRDERRRDARERDAEGEQTTEADREQRDARTRDRQARDEEKAEQERRNREDPREARTRRRDDYSTDQPGAKDQGDRRTDQDQQRRDARAEDKGRAPDEREVKRDADRRRDEERVQDRSGGKDDRRDGDRRQREDREDRSADRQNRDLVPDQPGAMEPDRPSDRRRSGTPDESVTPGDQQAQRAPKGGTKPVRPGKQDARLEEQRRDAERNQARQEAEARRKRQEQQRQAEKAAEAEQKAKRQRESSLEPPRNTRDVFRETPTDMRASKRNTLPQEKASTQPRKDVKVPPQQRVGSGSERLAQGEARKNQPVTRGDDRRRNEQSRADVKDKRDREERGKS